MIKAFVFDLDDTLISEMDYIKSGYKHVSKLLATELEISQDKIYSRMIELFQEDAKNVFNRLLDGLQINYDKEYIIKLVEAYRSHQPDIRFFNDVIPTLAKLKKMNIKLGVITDGYAISQRQKLRAVNADEYFDQIIVIDELGRDFWKPHPKAFRIMKEKLDVEFYEMIYVGDNPEKDFFISSIYPIKTIRVLRSKEGVHYKKKYYKNVSEDIRVQNLCELGGLVIGKVQ